MSRRTSRVRLSLLLGLSLALVACGDDPLAAPAAVTQVQVTPNGGTLVVGSTLQLTAVPRAANGASLPDRAVSWSTATTDRATVTAAGVLTGIAAGEVDVIATSEGVTTTLAFEVLPLPPVAIALDHEALTLMEGEGGALHVTLLNERGEPVEGVDIAWTGTDPSVVTVDGNGMVAAIGEGIATITAAHGALQATATIDVRPDLGAELIDDIAAGTPIAWPRLYRLDLRAAVPAPSPLLANAGTWQASASPDGARVAFTCDGVAICSAARDGSDVRVLTEGAANEDQPAWSPDGTQIAFRRWPAGGTPGQANPTDVWVMNADGTGQVNLTADAGTQHSPAWSPRQPDGSYRIVFSDESLDGGYLVARLATMRSDGADRQWLTSAGAHVDEDPTWSPDGGTIVFVRTGDGALGDLWKVTVATGAESPFLSIDLPGPQRAPRWSPAGRHLLFTSAHEPSADDGMRHQLYTAGAAGTRVIRRTNDEGEKEHPAWLPRP